MNYFSMLDTRFPTIHDEKSLRLRTFLGLARYLVLSLIFTKLTLIRLLNGSCPKLRLFLSDWTMIDEPISSSHHMRFLATLCFFGLCVKSVIFFRAALNPGILEYLVNDPRENKNNKHSELNIMKLHKIDSTIHTTRTTDLATNNKLQIRIVQNSSAISESSDRQRLASDDKLSRLIRLFMGFPSQSQPRNVNGCTYIGRDHHTIDNWIMISRRFEASFKLICSTICCTQGLAILFTFLKFIHGVSQSSECLDCSQTLRIFALIETLIVHLDGSFCAIGLLSHVIIVIIYLSNQAAWTRAHLSNYIHSLDLHQEVKGITRSDEDFTNHSLMLQQSDGESKVIKHKSMMRNIISSNSLAVVDQSHYTLSPKYFDNPMRNFSNTNSQKIVSKYIATVKYNEDKQRDYHDGLDKCEKRILDLLYSFDEQKSIISLMATIEYISLISNITMIPLIYAANRMGYISFISLFGYSISVISNVIICLRVANHCAIINYATLYTCKLMFGICARYPGEPIQIRWSLIYYNWFCPIRCVFKVGNFFELTYLNIIRTISFSISIVTVHLNFLNKFG